jgi:hypothetical protein
LREWARGERFENQEVLRVAAIPYMEGDFIDIGVFDRPLVPETLKHDGSQDLWLIF